MWRHRALLAGLLAFSLAFAGEWLLRVHAPEPAINPELGARLIQVAVLLIGVVAWVRDSGWRVQPSPASRQASSDPPTMSLPVRRAGETAGTQVPVRSANKTGWNTTPGQQVSKRQATGFYSRLRSRLGWRGTLAGLMITGGLGVWLGLLLREDFAHPFAPWVWLAMLAMLTITFAGVPPWPVGEALLPHDPSEPAREPPVDRIEWLLVLIIIAVSIAVRFWDLENIPAGPYIDEADRAIDARHLNRGEPVAQAPFIFFGTGWWGVPSFYFWLVAQSMKLFGDDLYGARVVHALAGVLAVWFTYRLGRAIWSPRAGIVAGALMAASDFAIQFSRTAGESTVTLTTWLICFYYLYKGLKTRQPLDFVLSGLAAGFTLYGYVSSKLLPVFMVFIALYLLVRWGFTGMRRYLPGLLLLALAAGLTYAPNGLYILTQNREAFTTRSNGVAIWSPIVQPTMVTTYGTDNWGVILAGQLGLTYSAFDVGRERGPFYPTDQPILPVPWAALWVIGTAYMVWRLGDARYTVMAIWLLSGLAGAVLTNETPSLQRVAGMVPLLALIPAVFIDRVASGLSPLVLLERGPTRVRLPRVGRWVLNGGIALLVAAMAAQSLIFYFGPYTAKANWAEFALAGHYVENLDPAKDVISHSNLPVWNGDPSPTIFLANKVPLREFGNASQVLPIINDEGKNFHLLFSPPDDPIGRVLESYYPGITRTLLSKAGVPVVAAYKLTAEQLDAPRRVTARYRSPMQPAIERKERRIGTSSNGEDVSLPAGLTYPADAEWIGGLVVPVYGLYDFNLDSPSGGALEIDGKLVLTTTQSVEPIEATVVLARGVHSVRLTGKMESESSQVSLRWGAGTGALAPVPRELLWDGPRGSLLGEAYGAPADLTWFTAKEVNAQGMLPLIERRDGFLSWQSINTTLNGGTSVFGVWRGKFRASIDGAYQFNTLTNGTAMTTLFIDGNLVGAGDITGMPPMPASVPLAAGEHSIELRYGAKQDNASLQLLWQPPGDAPRLMTPDVLLPLSEGMWLPSERPNVPRPDPAALGIIGTISLQVENVITPGGLREPRGVGVLPDGRFVIGDTGNNRLAFFDATGRRYASWGGAPAGSGTPDTFGQLSDVAVSSDGTIAALDAEAGDIRLFTPDGKLLAHLPNSKLLLNHSSGIAWGPSDGKLYVADTGGSRVVRFSLDGTEEATYREGSGTIESINQPVDVAVAADGTIYAVDLLGRVVRINLDGQIDREWKTGVGIQRGGSHLAIWNDQIAITNPDVNGLEFIDPKANLMRKIENKGALPLDLAIPVGIAPGPANSLMLLNSGNGTLSVLQLAP